MPVYNNFIYVVVIAAVLGAYVYKQNRRDSQNITFALLCLGIAMWTFGIYLLQITHIFYWPDKISLLGAIIMAGSFYSFSQVFPSESYIKLNPKEHWKTNAFVRMIPLVLMILILPFNLIIEGIEISGDTFQPINGPLYPLFALVCGFYVFITMVNFGIQYRNNIGYKRQRMLYVALSLVFFIVISLISDVILPAFNVAAWKFVGPLSAVVFLVLSTLALISYNLLDIRLVLKSVMVNTFALTIAIIAMVQTFPFISSRAISDSQALTIIFFFAILIFIFVRYLCNWMYSKFFLHDYYVFRDSFNELNIFLHEEISASRIIFTTNKYLLKGLGLSWMYYFDLQTRQVISDPNPNPVLSGKLTEDQVLDEEFNLFVGTLRAVKFFYGAEFGAFPITNSPIAVLPLWNKGELQGYFLLGPQRSLKGLSFEETQRLQHAWAHIETAFDRALLYQSLEQKVKAQVEDITYKNKKLKELVQNRLDFIQITSHQLRTPITSLSGALQLVLQEGIDPADQKEMVTLAYEKSKELTNTITGILKIARLEKGEDPGDTQDRVNLNEVFAPLLPIVEAEAGTKNIYVEFNPVADPIVYGNKLYLEQAFYNILENAVAHTSEGGVRIFFNEDPDTIIVVIKDTGSGIPPEIQDRVFSKKTFGVNSKGTGLGLYIAKTIIDAHPEGKIWFDSDQDGTAFYISLKRFPLSGAILKA